MKYESLRNYSRQEAAIELVAASAYEVSQILQGLASSDGDVEWKQELIEKYFSNSDVNVRISAVKALGILCRLNESVDVERALNVLNSKIEDLELLGYIEEVLEDIKIYRL